MTSFLKRSVSLRACSVVALVGSLFAGGAARADQAVISILANRAIVGAEAAGNCGWEPEQVQLALQPAFTSQLFEPYSAAAIAARLVAGELVIIPDQETASLLASWGADASLVRSALQAGGRMLVFGDLGANDTQLLNYMLSGSSASPLIDAGTAGTFTRNPTAPSPFNTSPSSLTVVNGTYKVRGWNPADVVYSGGVGGLDVAVATSQVGAGRLGFIAYDFYCPGSDPIDAAAWAVVTRAMVQHLMPVPTANFTVSLASASTSVTAGDTFTVRASCTAPAALLSGAQLAVHFDAARLRLDAVTPYATSPLDMELAEQINNTTGTLRYALGMSDPSTPLDVAADLCNLTFTVLPGADLCGAANLVTFGDVGAFTTRFTRFDNAAPVVPALTNLPPINLDSTPPVLTGVPAADITVATDAGSTFGALVSLPTVTAVDACEGAVSVTVTGAIASGLYPIGTTTVTWSATDSVGNAVSVSRDIVVGDYQLLDARISFNGVLTANAPRSIRVSAGASVGVHPVTVLAGTGGFGMIAGIVVPVATSYPCVAAKDTVHSLTRTAAASIVGSHYEATFALVQGDSNDDDMIEIVDYATWVIDFGSGKALDARSNFNADALVNNADLGFVSTGFFTVGESCTGGLAGARPRERISVKELRRAGLGELAAADLNRDGWFDMRDMQIAVQGNAGGNGGGAVAQPAAASERPNW